MNAVIKQHSKNARESLLAQEGGAFLKCDWIDFVLIHYALEPKLLQEAVPFELDLFEGQAYVSLVAFTLNNFRFAVHETLGRLPMLPVHTHRYFNVRTYIKHENNRAIYFMKEWMSSRLCAVIGAQMYGLPCEYGRLNYNHRPTNEAEGKVTTSQGAYQYKISQAQEAGGIEPGTLEEFLFERYTAFIAKDGIKKFFRIWHEPWKQAAVNIEYVNDQLLPTLGPWGHDLKPTAAHYAPGVYGVWMGKPITLG